MNSSLRLWLNDTAAVDEFRCRENVNVSVALIVADMPSNEGLCVVEPDAETV